MWLKSVFTLVQVFASNVPLSNGPWTISLDTFSDCAKNVVFRNSMLFSIVKQSPNFFEKWFLGLYIKFLDELEDAINIFDANLQTQNLSTKYLFFVAQ